MIAYLITLVVVGLVVGAVARVLLPGPDPIGIGLTILVGIGGSVVGGWIGDLILGRPGGFVLGVLCAMLILYLLRRSRTV